jgi:predicted Zn-dependent protease
MDEVPRRRRLDIRFLALFLALMAFLGIGTHFLHAYQVKRNCRLLKDEAARAEAGNDLAKATDYLGRYIGLAPGDVEAAGRYALLLEKRAKLPREKYKAYLALESVLIRETAADLNDVRRRAAEVALSFGRPAEARVHLQRLLQSTPADPGLEDLLGQSAEAARQFADARTAYERSLKLSPGRAPTAVRLAHLLHSNLNPASDAERAAEADEVMDALVRADPDSCEARIARSRYRQTFGNLYLAEQDLACARDKLPADDTELLVASAEVADARRRPEEARKHLELGRQHHPRDARFPMALARLELQVEADHRHAAIELLRDALQTANEDAETLWTLADLFLDAGAPADAQKLVDRLRGLGAPEAAMACVTARLLASEQKFGEAVTLLERSRAGVTSSDETGYLYEKSNLLLAAWHERLGNPEQQLAAYERVLHEHPKLPVARAGKAAALVALGSAELAVPIYRSMLEEWPGARLSLVRALLVHNCSLPADRWDWAEAEALLQGAAPKVKDTPAHRLLFIDLLSLSGRHLEAVAEAEAACKAHPDEIRYWLARAALADHGDGPDAAKALAVLAEAKKHAGDTVDLRLARVDRLGALPPAEARRELLALEDGSRSLSAADQGRLEAGLAEEYVRLRDIQQATRLLAQAAGRLPGDVAIREKLFDLAMLAGDKAAAERQVEDVRRIEGEEGVLWRSEEVARKIAAYREGRTASLAEARQQLAEIEQRRAGWARALVLEAEIAELDGKTDLALEYYQKAIDRGVRQTWVARRAVELLAIRRRPEDARDLLQNFLARVPAAGADLNRMLIELTASNGQATKQSVDMVQAAVSPNSKYYRDFVWRGQLLSTLGDAPGAEAALRKAVRLNESAVDARLALVVFLADAGRRSTARAELEDAHRAVAENKRPTLLAAGLEAVGEPQAAEAAYVAMLRASPESPDVRRALAAFYLRTEQGAKAEPLLRSLSQGDGPDAARARRSLALCLGATGDFAKSEEALKLIDANLGGKWSGPEDERARTIVLAMRPGDRRASIQMLEESFKGIKPTAQEEFLLAKVYDADGNWAKAKEHLHALVSKQPGNTPQVLAFFIKALLRENEPAEAKRCLTELERREPDSERTVGLTARLLVAEGNGQEAARSLTDFANSNYTKNQDAAVFQRTAALFAELGRPADAEALLGRYIAESEKTRPESLLTMAKFLARQDRLGEALDFCDRAAAARCNPELVAEVAVNAVRQARPTAAERDRVRVWLDNELQKKPNSAALLIARADLFDLYGDYGASQRAYRDLLARYPDNVAALNNLAWLLAVQENQGDEALTLIVQALRLRGAVAPLLDTQARVYLALGQCEKAVTKMEEAVRQAPTPTRYFHLSQALAKAGRSEAAGDAWRKATKELLLTEKQVHPLEKADFRALSTAFSKEKL